MKDKYDSRQWQSKAKEENESKILAELMNNPKRFTDLQKSLGFSATGLTKILDRMKQRKTIQKVQHDGHLAYSTTKSGEHQYRKSLGYGDELNGIQDKGGKIEQDFSGFQGAMWFTELKWGIMDTLVVSKNLVGKTTPLTKKLVWNLQEVMFKQMHANAQENNFEFDESLDGTMVLNLSFDYKELIHAIEDNSLKKYKNVSEEELNIRAKYEDMSVTTDEAQLLQRFKKGRLSKIQFKKYAKELEKQIKRDEKNGIHHETLENSMKKEQ